MPDAAGFVIQVARIRNPEKRLSLSPWEGQAEELQLQPGSGISLWIVAGQNGVKFFQTF